MMKQLINPYLKKKILILNIEKYKRIVFISPLSHALPDFHLCLGLVEQNWFQVSRQLLTIRQCKSLQAKSVTYINEECLNIFSYHIEVPLYK